VQTCVVSLDPVTTRIEESVQRRYIANFEDPDEEDVEMTADENTEPLAQSVDAAAVMIEALSLALPLYPRKDGADLGEAVYTDKELTPMTDDDAKPFAGLGAKTPINTRRCKGLRCYKFAVCSRPLIHPVSTRLSQSLRTPQRLKHTGQNGPFIIGLRHGRPAE